VDVNVALPVTRMIVPRRRDNGHRDRLWAFCRQHWRDNLDGLGDWQLAEGHHDDGPFNRSAAINRAAELGATREWDVAIILDADVILDPTQVFDGVRLAAETGCMVLPFRKRLSLTEAGTREIVDHPAVGYPWGQWVEEEQDWNVSTAVIVTRELFDQVGGFDERFVGWGGEDEAFHAACLALAGVSRVDGPAWHLWHPRSPWRDHGTVDYAQVLGLADRYVTTADPKADRRRPDRMTCSDPEPMRRLLAEPRTPEQVVLVAVTNGRRVRELNETLESADWNLHGAIGRRVLVCDGCHVEREGWDTVTVRGGNYPRAMEAARRVAVGSGQPWVFWLEDDFTFNYPVNLWDLQDVMDRNPHLAQLSLMRQPWWPNEIEAGSVIASLPPELFVQRAGFVEQGAYWTMNPMLTRRTLLAGHAWPQGADSEARFGHRILNADKDARFGILGRLDDQPRVNHIGVERAGRGY